VALLEKNIPFEEMRLRVPTEEANALIMQSAARAKKHLGLLSA
jgi:hypothetical protein